MENLIRKSPKCGDIFFVQDGEKRFIAGADATKAFVDTLDAVGVVFHTMGKRFLVVGGQNTMRSRLYPLRAEATRSNY